MKNNSSLMYFGPCLGQHFRLSIPQPTASLKKRPAGDWLTKSSILRTKAL